ncbi:hypothetical protein [Neptuniibacter sp. QD37_11]|uniref:hypothetical protein n=1 Tax=Neptuniibacter sp. QD37_11 TaxID=3398209 RepID=UPI0039F4FDE9
MSAKDNGSIPHIINIVLAMVLSAFCTVGVMLMTSDLIAPDSAQPTLMSLPTLPKSTPVTQAKVTCESGKTFVFDNPVYEGRVTVMNAEKPPASTEIELHTITPSKCQLWLVHESAKSRS